MIPRLVLGMLLAGVCLSTQPSLAGKVVADKDAKEHAGEYLTVEGLIVDVHTSSKGNTFLNFGAAYPNQTFTAVVFHSVAAQFEGLHDWQGKRARVTGVVKLYKGKAEIILDRPSQLKGSK